MDFGGDSDGDVFGGGVFEQMAPIQHQANELFCFKPKLRSFNICYATEVTRFSSPKQDLVKALSSKQPPHPGRVLEACELNHYALESVRRGAGREVEEDGRCAERRYKHEKELP
ncbi:hypothetical protein V8E54_014572 [Elaphomyces granulatus]|jgi:hypothetical protein